MAKYSLSFCQFLIHLQDLSYAKDELARYKTNFSVEISGREAEIEALRWEVTSLKVRVMTSLLEGYHLQMPNDTDRISICENNVNIIIRKKIYFQKHKSNEGDGPQLVPDADKKVQSLTSMLLQRQSMLEAAVMIRTHWHCSWRGKR